MQVLFFKRWWRIGAIGAAILAGLASLFHPWAGDFVRGASPFDRLPFFKSTGETMSTVPVSRRIEHVGADDFREKVLLSEVPVLVDFYADWCGPCKVLTPVLEEFAKETPTAKIVKVNVDESPELAAQYRIDSIPSLLVFRDNRVTGKHTGLANKSLLRRLVSH